MTASKQSKRAPDTLDTPSGVRIRRSERIERYTDAVLPLQAALDSHRGVLLTSSFEYPGRYTRWDIGFVDPPLAFTSRGRTFAFEALNARGALLLAPIANALETLDAVAALETSDTSITGTVRESDEWFPEELRSKALGWTKVQGPGEQDTLVVDVQAPGTYSYVCTFPGHFVNMKGVLVAR